MLTSTDGTGVSTRVLRTADAILAVGAGAVGFGPGIVGDDPLWPAAFVPAGASWGDEGFRFDDAGRPIAYAAGGRALQLTWDDGDRLVGVAEGDGQATRIAYDAHDNPVGVAVNRQAVLSIAYDEADLATAITDGFGRTVAMEYDAAGNLIRVVEPDGGAWSIGYDAAHRPTAIEIPGQGRFLITYDGRGRPIRMEGPGGRFTDYAYDDLGRLVAETDQGERARRFVYDRSGRVTAVLDPTIGWVDLAYDATGRVVRAEAEGGVSIGYAYDGDGRPLEVVPSAGPAQRFAYGPDGRLVRLEDGMATVTVEDLPDGGVAVTVEEGGATETAVYAADGRLMWSDSPAGRVDMEYDGNGLISAIRTGGGLSVEIERDAQGRPLATAASDGLAIAVTGYTYDADGNLVARAAEDGSVDRFTYDDGGRLAAVVDGRGAEYRYTYDEAGRVAALDGPAGRWTWAYDAAGRVVAETAPNVGTYLTEYEGMAERVTDPDGNVTTIETDLAARTVTVTDPLGGVTVTSYDVLGNPSTLTDANGHVAAWAYDGLGRPTGFEFDGLTQVTTEYDGAGNVVRTSHGNGAEVILTHADGAPVRAAWDDGTTWTYLHDAFGRLAEASDAAGAYRYDYDRYDRLALYTDPWDGSAAFAYDDHGRLAGVDVAGTSFALGYSPGGQPAEVAAGPHRVAYAPDRAGRVAGISHGNGMAAELSYDDGGRLASVVYRDAAGGVIHEERLSYDGRGLVASVTRDGGTTSFAYDAVGRLVSAEGAEPAGFAYDATGNVTGTADGRGWAYGGGGLLTQWGGTTVESDGAGNVTAVEGVGAFSYRHGDHLAEADVAGAATTYGYSPEGQVVRIDRGADGVEHVVRVGPYRLASRFVDGVDVVYAPGPDPRRWAFVLIGGEAYYPVWSHAGNLVALTDSTGAVVRSYAYDVYGQVLSQTGDLPVPPHFHGQPHDQATGLYDFGARFYSPRLIRFLTPDPLGPDETGNRFAFASGNPLVFTDLGGLMSVPAGTVAPTPLPEPWRAITPRVVGRELGRLAQGSGPAAAAAREALTTLATGEGSLRGAPGRGIVAPGTGGGYPLGGYDAWYYPDNLYARSGGDLRQTLRAAAGVAAHELDHLRVFTNVEQGGPIRFDAARGINRYNLLHEYSARLRQWRIDPYLGGARIGPDGRWRAPMTPLELVDDTARTYGHVRGATQAYHGTRPDGTPWRVGRIGRLEDLAVNQQYNRPVEAQVSRLRSLGGVNPLTPPQATLVPTRDGAVREGLRSVASRVGAGASRAGSALGRFAVPRVPGAVGGGLLGATVSYAVTGRVNVSDVALGTAAGAFPNVVGVPLAGYGMWQLGTALGDFLARLYLSITGALDAIAFEIENAEELFGPLGQEMEEFRAGWTPGPLYVHPDLIGKDIDEILAGIDDPLVDLIREAREEAEEADYELGQLEAILADLRRGRSPSPDVQGLTVAPSLPERSVAERIREAIGVRDAQLDQIRTMLSTATDRPWSLTMDPQSRLRVNPEQ